MILDYERAGGRGKRLVGWGGRKKERNIAREDWGSENQNKGKTVSQKPETTV